MEYRKSIKNLTVGLVTSLTLLSTGVANVEAKQPHWIYRIPMSENRGLRFFTMHQSNRVHVAYEAYTRSCRHLPVPNPKPEIMYRKRGERGDFRLMTVRQYKDIQFFVNQVCANRELVPGIDK